VAVGGNLAKEKTPDRRVQRTRRLLHKALMSRVLEKKYESITVQEILDRADVGRSTFYLHFQDKDELLASGLQNVSQLVRSAQAAFTAPPGKSYEKIIGFSLAMFEHAYEYRAVQRAMLGSNAEPIVRRQIHGALAAVIGQEVKSEFQKRKRDDCSVSPELLTHFLVSSFISVMTWWLNARNPVPPKDIDAAYRALVLPSLASVFG
jgi:AcrR family transcriptional regulator